MKFKLQLKNHCIETALRRLYNNSISEYFKNPTKTNEAKIALLEIALRNINFPELRSKYPELNGSLQREIEIDIKHDKISIKIPSYAHPIEINIVHKNP